MQLKRLLPSVVVVTCISSLVALQDPDVCEQSPADAAVSPLSGIDGRQPENPVSLAQTSWSRGKVPFLPVGPTRSNQASYGLLLRAALGVLLFLSAIFAYSGLPHMSSVPLISTDQPRRLASTFLQSLSGEVVTSKSTQDAARRTVSNLRLRGMRHRMARMDEGDDGILDDDRDAAKTQGYLSRAEAYAQRQQFEKAAKLFEKGVHMAEGMLQDLKKDHTAQVAVDEFQHQVCDALLRTATFYLERGQTVKARKAVARASRVIAVRTDAAAMQFRLLAANVLRDAGDLDDSVVAYELLLAKIHSESETATNAQRAMLDEVAAEAHGEMARTMISQGKVVEAHKLLEETLEKITPSGVTVPQESSILLAARLKGWLAFATLKEGSPVKAIDLVDQSLASLGELPAGIAGATTEVQEFLQTRAAAKAELGRLHSAAEDLEVVRGLQDELKQTIIDKHNPKYAAGDGDLPDPRLWTSMARTRTIAADLKLQAKAHAGEALALGREARNLLREVKKSDGRIPKGYNLATFVEVKALIAKAKAQLQTSATSALPAPAEPESEAEEVSHDNDTPTVVPEAAEDSNVKDVPHFLTEES